MAQTTASADLIDFKHDEQCEAVRGGYCRCTVREMGWIAREARELMAEIKAVDARNDAFMVRKRALMAYVAQTQEATA